MNDTTRKPPANSSTIRSSNPALDAAFEPHFKCWELAEKWGFSENYIYALFVNEPGVIKPPAKSKNKRVRVSLRIPLSVALRVYERIQNKRAS